MALSIDISCEVALTADPSARSVVWNAARRHWQDQEVVMEIDNVHKRPITLHGSGKKKGLGIGQKFNFRFDIEYEGKTECFFVEDEASMNSWVERTSNPPSSVGTMASMVMG